MGRYVEGVLSADEPLRYETGLHWKVYFELQSFLTLGLAPLIERRCSEFSLTDRRLIVKTGWMAHSVSELSARRIESVQVEQSLLGRWLDYGTVTVVGSGGTREVLKDIARPLDFKHACMAMC